jgi:hypothetical protein
MKYGQNANPRTYSLVSFLDSKTHTTVSTPFSKSRITPADTVLSSISDTQTESSDGTLKHIGLRLSDEEKADTGDGHNEDEDERDGDRTAKGATGVTGVRDSSKRNSGQCRFERGGRKVCPGRRRSERIGQSAGSVCRSPSLFTAANDARKDSIDETR